MFNRDALPPKSFASYPFLHIHNSKVRSKIKLYQSCLVFSFLEEIFVLSSDSSADIFFPKQIERIFLQINKQCTSEMTHTLTMKTYRFSLGCGTHLLLSLSPNLRLGFSLKYEDDTLLYFLKSYFFI